MLNKIKDKIKSIKHNISSKTEKADEITLKIDMDDYINVGMLPEETAIKLQSFMHSKYPKMVSKIAFIDANTHETCEPHFGAISLILISKSGDGKDVLPLIVTKLGSESIYVKKDYWEMYNQGKNITLN